MKTTVKIAVIAMMGMSLGVSAQNFNSSDLRIGLNDGRSKGSKEGQRALVHYINDELIINYNGDFEGGTKIQSSLSVSGDIHGRNLRFDGTDFQLGLNNVRSKGSKEGQRALVHYINDELIINYNGDFEGGTKIQSNLAVLGKIESKEIKVTTSPTADFVFEEDYDLPTLVSIEKHIKEKKHLPEIASAKEMEKNGVNVGDFQIQLLQKIEELTLYTIEQEKKIKKLEKQQKEIEELKKQNFEIKELVQKLLKDKN
ncbi:hypothetical protein [Tenacibaculum sp. C7A-26P2]|uniref:hypothetical protein n=1 Tax=Tenacibaculum sp. C7A-26P2 TaxID=3447504 RepID=UPI003F868450